jgi:hypothetical protein
MVAFDPRKPNIARIYDALRDGKDNFGPIATPPTRSGK